AAARESRSCRRSVGPLSDGAGSFRPHRFSAESIRGGGPMVGMATLSGRAHARPTRRNFLATASSAMVCMPAFVRAGERPQVTHRIQSGDVSIDSGVVWARADRPARMLIEVATTESFRNVRNALYVDALPETDFTAKALIEGLPAGQDIFYRIQFQDHSF